MVAGQTGDGREEHWTGKGACIWRFNRYDKGAQTIGSFQTKVSERRPHVHSWKHLPNNHGTEFLMGV